MADRLHAPRRPTTWAEWAYFDGDPAVTDLGSDVFEWALSVTTEFYSDDWFAESINRFDCPVMKISNWPLRNPHAVVRLLERATRLQLMPTEAREALRPSVSLTSDEFTHLELLLEVSGLAIRAGWRVSVEQELQSKRRPDLTVAQLGREFLVELTVQGFSRAMRGASDFGGAIETVIHSVEVEFDVETSTRVQSVVDDSTIEKWRNEFRAAAGEVVRDGQSRSIEVDGIVSRISEARRPERTTYDGPIVAEDAWARFGVRLLEKAKQTAGGARSWIRIDEVGGLILLTPVAYLEPHEQLRALQYNLEATLSDYPHVVGVLISLGAGPNWAGTAPQFTFLSDPAEGWRSATVIERVLPGARRRRSFAIPLRSNRLLIPGGAELPIARWYAEESTWLDWSLRELGKPRLTEIIDSRASRMTFS